MHSFHRAFPLATEPMFYLSLKMTMQFLKQFKLHFLLQIHG